MAVYVTGDIHRDLKRVASICHELQTTQDDILVLLGDTGINLYSAEESLPHKEFLHKLPITLLCLRGNHDRNPEEMDVFQKTIWNGGVVYQEEQFENILFSDNGTVFEFDGTQALVVGGAYSIDSAWRQQAMLDILNYSLVEDLHDLTDEDYMALKGARVVPWYHDEQLSDEEKLLVEQVCEEHDWDIPIVLTHTCPYEARPTDAFRPFVDQDTVDTSTEEWLSTLASRLTFERWYFGHYHIDRENEKYLCLLTEVRDVLTNEVVLEPLPNYTFKSRKRSENR